MRLPVDFGLIRKLHLEYVEEFVVASSILSIVASKAVDLLRKR